MFEITIPEQKLVVYAHLFIPIRMIPKQRPRFSGRRVHMPSDYMSFKEELAMLFRQSWGHWLPGGFPDEIQLVGYWVNSKKGDFDNLIGTAADALQPDFIKSDSAKYINSGISKFVNIAPPRVPGKRKGTTKKGTPLVGFVILVTSPLPPLINLEEYLHEINLAQA